MAVFSNLKRALLTAVSSALEGLLTDAGAAPRTRLSGILRPTTAVAVTFGFVLLALYTVKIDADQLVRDALKAETIGVATRPGGAFVTFTPDGIGEPVSLVQVLGPRGNVDFVAAHLPSLVTHRLESLNFDLAQPLSVAAFADWRNSLAQKQERVERDRSDGTLTLRTTTTAGDLREAVLTLESDTYRVTREMLVFPGVGRLEFAVVSRELAEALAPLAERRPAATIATPSSSIPAYDPLDLTELRARFVVGAAALDMQGDVRVFRLTGSVHVDGIVPRDVPTRAARTQLAALPGVTVTLRPKANDPASGGLAQAQTGSPAVPGSSATSFAGNGSRDAFVPALTGQIATVHRRLEILRELATRYPEPEVQAFPRDAQGALQRLLDLHYRALNRALLQLDTRVAMLGGTQHRAPLTPRVPSDWRSRIGLALSQTTALDALTRDLVFHDDLTPLQQQHLAEMFDGLWDAWH